MEDQKTRKEKGFLLKLDLEKTYDMVNWEFLNSILELKGFGFKWRKWIKGCLTTTNLSIMINGRSRGKIMTTRGLRLGDPLSPFLFTIVGDAISKSVQFCIEKKILRSWEIGNHKAVLSMLQYADDTLIFCPDNELDIANWWDILKLIMAGTGLSLNMEKTSMIGINVNFPETSI